MATEFWGLLWTTLATVVLLVAPVIIYAYSELDRWIGDDSFDRVMSSVATPKRFTSTILRPGPVGR
ncbi:MAG TPA: hypothetical protein VKC65_00235 [Gaiellaceae bacterium]|nr:hypothetical protein [Gaiellaceae bacterium]